MNSKLALLGGEKTVKLDQGDMFTWPIITKEHEEAVLEVLRAGKMSGLDITKEFEKEYGMSGVEIKKARQVIFEPTKYDDNDCAVDEEQIQTC